MSNTHNKMNLESIFVKGGLAQLVERTVRIGEARGSKPRTSNEFLFVFLFSFFENKKTEKQNEKI